MLILLINSNIYQNPPVIPFGLCCVAAALEQAGHEVHVLDLCFSTNRRDEIEYSIRRISPELIGISVRNIDSSTGYKLKFLLHEVKEAVIEPCKNAFSGPIVIGGPCIGINGPEILNFFGLHYAIQGDGEAAMLEFVDRIGKNLPVSGIAGLIWRRDDRDIEQNPPWRVGALDTLPFVNPTRYFDVSPYIEQKATLQIQSKRGCALQCTYCTYNRIEGRRYRYFDPQRVADEVEYLVKKTGISDIEFADSTFNVPLAHAKEVLRKVAAKNLNARFFALGISPMGIDEELIDLMRKVNFGRVTLGIEAGNDAMLKSLGKNFTTQDIRNAGKVIHSRNMPIHWCLLLGAPGETEETIRETFNTMEDVVGDEDRVIISIGLRVYKGTPLSNTLLNEGADCPADNFFTPFVYSPSALNIEEMVTLTEQITRTKDNYDILGTR